uniref:Latrophilin Cirl-like isoform X3 n=1 Tax=Dermatophagoides pteronyssinus TaxID=6956 RepID=A0A6P6YAD7_DERPT|nr:latrophilin Cirl-like isoform X3 [Dermatophagoides pteronyssinus]
MLFQCKNISNSNDHHSQSSSTKTTTIRRPNSHLTMLSFIILAIIVSVMMNGANVVDGGLVHGQQQQQETKKEWSSSTTLRRPRYHTLYACEGNSLEIQCDEGTHINLIRANFGRFSISVCNEQGNVDWSVNCMAHRSFRVIQESCGSKNYCKLPASTTMFDDPCPGTLKYLEAHYQCVKDNHSDGNFSHHVDDDYDNNQASNHHHNGHHNHHHQVSFPPVVLFPEPPMQPSNGIGSSTALPPHIDLTSQDIKDQEEAVEKAPLSIVDEPGPIQVKPPKPIDLSEDSSSMDQDDNNYDLPSSSDDTSNDTPYNRASSSSTTTVSSNPFGHHHVKQHPFNNAAQYPQSESSEPSSSSFPSLSIGKPVPTAKPPKPDNYDPPQSPSSSYSENDDPSSSYTSQPDDVLLVPVPVPVPSIDLVYDYCRPMYAKNLNWNWTMAGNVLRQACPIGARGIARWSCIIDNGEPTWTPHLPDMSNCSSLWIAHLLDRLRSQESIFSLAEELAKQAKGKILYSGDLISAADIIKQLVIRLETKLEESKDDQDRRAHLIKELLNSVLNVASNLLEEIQMESWHELNPHDQRLAIRTMIRAMERIAELLADVRSQPNYNFVRTHNNILVSVHVHSLASLENGMHLPFVLSQYDSSVPSMSDSTSNEVSVHIPYEVLVQQANDQGQVKVIFLMYRRLANLLKIRTPTNNYHDYPIHLQPYAYKQFSERNDYEYPMYQYQRHHNNHHHYPNNNGMYRSSTQTIINSDIVGLILATDFHEHSSYDRLPVPLNGGLIELTFRHLQTENVTNGRCAYWDMKRIDEDTFGDWSTAGCETISTNRTHTSCRCNHLTNFAVLMDITNVPMDANDEYVLRMITRIGCSISIIALAITLLTLSVYRYVLYSFIELLHLLNYFINRNLNSIRNSIHKHLCACLLVAEVIFLLGIDETRIKLVCGLIAIALHYFFLASFLWMFFEGLQLYTMLVQVFENRHNRMTIYSLVAYGAPALLVIVAALVDPLSYGTSQHCWLRTDNHFIWSFLGPALAILLANALFLTLAISIICKHSPNSIITSTTTNFSTVVHQKNHNHHQQQQQHLKVYPSSTLTPSPSYSISTEHSKMHSIKIWIRTSISLLVMLGLTWSIGVFYLARPTFTMAFIFTVFNSLQGLLIFIFCCILNEKVRQEYRNSLTRSCRRCFFFRTIDQQSMAFGTKSSSDSTRSTSLRDSHHLIMNGGSTHVGHHLSQQHLYMQQPAASFLGSRNVSASAAPRTSLLYLNELLGKTSSNSETPTAVANSPTTDQPLIPTQMIHSTPSIHQFQNNLQQINQDNQQQHFNHSRLSQALSSISQLTNTIQDDTSSSDYGCRRLTQMFEHIYECIDEDPYVAKLLLPAIQRSLDNHQARAHLCQQQDGHRNAGLTPALLATLNRASQRNLSNQIRLQPNSSYLSSGNNHHTIGHGNIGGLHLPAIVRDNTAMVNGKSIPNGSPAQSHQQQPQQQQQQTVALLDGDQVRCCTLNDHKLCDHQSESMNHVINNNNNNNNNFLQQQQHSQNIQQSQQQQQQQQQMINHQQMMNVLKGQNNNMTNGNRHHLASEC